MENTTPSKKKINEWRNLLRAMGICFLMGVGCFGLAWLAIVKDKHETVWPLPRQHPALFLPNILMIMAWSAVALSVLGLVGGAIVAVITKESK